MSGLFLALALAAAAAEPPADAATAPTVFAATGLRAHAFRLRPGDDLRQRLEQVARASGLSAAYVASAVGSVDGVALRLADQPNAIRFEGRHEIVSLAGTLSTDGVHLHLTVADASGATRGGHLSEGTRVYTTAEIVLIEIPGLQFEREPDPVTGYRELNITAPP